MWVQATCAVVVCWTWLAGVANGQALVGGPAAHDQAWPHTTVHVSVQLVTRGRLTAEQVEMLRQEIEGIWTPHGVVVTWGGPDPVLIDMDGPINVLPASPFADRWPLASIRFVDGHPVPSIHVSLDAISEVIRRARHPYALPVLKPRMVARAAGRVIGHELGHYLLATSDHASIGLMQAGFSPDALVERLDQPLRLEPRQVARLHASMMDGADAPRGAASVQCRLRDGLLDRRSVR